MRPSASFEPRSRPRLSPDRRLTATRGARRSRCSRRRPRDLRSCRRTRPVTFPNSSPLPLWRVVARPSLPGRAWGARRRRGERTAHSPPPGPSGQGRSMSPVPTPLWFVPCGPFRWATLLAFWRGFGYVVVAGPRRCCIPRARTAVVASRGRGSRRSIELTRRRRIATTARTALGWSLRFGGKVSTTKGRVVEGQTRAKVRRAARHTHLDDVMRASDLERILSRRQQRRRHRRRAVVSERHHLGETTSGHHRQAA
jgi:hypothetical protein